MSTAGTKTPPSPGPNDRAARVAVIGAGYFAQFHHEAWHRVERADLVAVVDRDLAKAEKAGAPAFDDAAAMLSAVRPDIIDIATPPETHLEMIALALERGVRTVICQKPFCGDQDQAMRAAELAADAGATLVVHENFRFQPWYRALKHALDVGRVGRVHNLSFRLRPGDGKGPNAYLDRQPYFREMPRFLIHETGIHWIDTFRFLLGNPVWVFADLRRLNPEIAGEDAGTVLFGYASGVRALLDGNRLLDHPAENRRLTMGECSLEGEDGEIRLTGDGKLLFRHAGSDEAAIIFEPETVKSFGGDCVFALQTHVVAGVLDGAPIENLAASYMRNLHIEAAVYRSALEGKRIDIVG